MKTVRYSAPAKVILSGEHAVVYGKPALVCAIHKKLTVSFTHCKNKKSLDRNIELVDQVVRNYIVNKAVKASFVPFSYLIQSDIPIGRGLGSSAAYSAACCGGLLEWYTGKQWEQEDINNCAYQVEKKFHKNPSGVDNTTSVFGGLVYYRKEFEFLKSISSLSLQIPHSIQSCLFLIDSGNPFESTAEMVMQVGKLYNKKLQTVEKTLSSIEKVTKRMVVSMAKEDTVFFSQTIEENERLLEKLGVVSSCTETLLSELKKFGVGKITGAGGKKEGSGYILFFAQKEKELTEYLDTNTITYFPLIPSKKGVQKVV